MDYLILIGLGWCMGVVILGVIYVSKLAVLVSRLEHILGWALVLHRENQDAAPDSGSGSQRRVEP